MNLERMETLTEEIKALPMVDGHNHATFPRIWQGFDGGERIDYASASAEALTDLDSMAPLWLAGLTREEFNGIRYGKYDRETSLRTLLKYMEDIRATNHAIFTKKGLELCYGVKLDGYTLEGLLEVDARADECRDFDVLFDRGNIRRVMLNMWNTLGISYYGEYMDTMTEKEIAADRRCNRRIATFDYHSTPPFSPRTHKFARLCGTDYENFDEYDAFLEKLADFYVNQKQVVGFKFSEAYFRALDYRPVRREEAKACYKENMSIAEKRKLSDYVSLKILEMARGYGIPAQFHTGRLWGSSDMSMINPYNLEPTIKAMPDLRFDLLHCGFPYCAETGLLANTYPNVYININPMVIRSFDHTKLWLDVYLNQTSTDHILFGTDMFTPECTVGNAYYTRILVAESMCDRLRRELLSPADALETARKLLYKNAERLYRIEE